MSNSFSRRTFLRASLLGSSGLLAPGGLDVALAAMAHGPQLSAEGYGPLVPDPQGLLDLPAGFRYRALSTGVLDADRATDARFASALTNGDPTPAQHDGMAAFPGPDGATILVRNHEMELDQTPHVDVRRERPYDPLASGGTTTLWVDRERNLVRSFASLSGTLRNCAGGRTPWHSWLTCEETTLVPGERDPVHIDFDGGVHERHGYIFEVDSRSEQLVEPVALKAMGRFRHEAVAVDPATGFAYLSEDRDDGLFYRFKPDAVARGGKPSALRVGDYARGGVLEALRVRARPRLLTRNQDGTPVLTIGESFEVDWVRIEHVDPDEDTLLVPAAGAGSAGGTRVENAGPDSTRAGNSGRSADTASAVTADSTSPAPPEPSGTFVAAPSSTRAQGFSLGCAAFARTEGMAFAHGSIYFCCTNGGPRKLGQVFRLDLRRERLSLVVQPEDDALLDGPDNICVAPHGDLLICEDNLAYRENFVVGVTPRGACYRIARNAHPGRREFAGACFALDGETLFVNLQQPGITFAIWGPWGTRRA